MSSIRIRRTSTAGPHNFPPPKPDRRRCNTPVRGQDRAGLARRPHFSPLFPYLITGREKDRATEFKQRCKGLGITDIRLDC